MHGRMQSVSDIHLRHDSRSHHHAAVDQKTVVFLSILGIQNPHSLITLDDAYILQEHEHDSVDALVDPFCGSPKQ